MHNTFKVGLTGGIACGKTSACRVFSALQIPVVDADVISRQLCARGSPLLPQIAAIFGPLIINAACDLNRPALRELVIADEAALTALNNLLHPAIHRELMAQAETAGKNAPYVVLAIPLLFEHHLEPLVNRILVLDCSPELQLARIQKRDGCSEAAARSIISHQAAREYRLSQGADVINTESGDLHYLAQQIEMLHAQYLQAASAMRRDPVSEA